MACLSSLSNAHESAEVMRRYLAAAYLDPASDEDTDYVYTAGVSPSCMYSIHIYIV